MKILVTGATGVLGKCLVRELLANDHDISLLVRDSAKLPPELAQNCEVLAGDILLYNLGLSADKKWDFDAVYHLAGIVKLDSKHHAELFKVNTGGTLSTLNFVLNNDIPHIYYVSTSYVDRVESGVAPRNSYEWSKYWAEQIVREFAKGFAGLHPPIKATIFRPSILIEDPNQDHISLQGFNQFVRTVARIHRRVEIVRRKIEGTLRLPVIEPLFRIHGNPEGKMNLVLVSEVAAAMANINKTGTFYLTNPDPPVLKELQEWVGQELLMKIRIQDKFKSTPIEGLFARMMRSFIPYFEGDNLPSDMQSSGIDSEIIRGVAKKVCLA